eukprot:404536-Pleurochrysis_carterae.AAC.1
MLVKGAIAKTFQRPWERIAPTWTLERDRNLRKLGHASLTSITRQTENEQLHCMSKTCSKL